LIVMTYGKQTTLILIFIFLKTRWFAGMKLSRGKYDDG